jgi:hypothetical protein
MEGFDYTFLGLTYREKMSSADAIEIQLRASDAMMPTTMIGSPFHLSWNWGGEEQYAHGKIIGISLTPDTSLTNMMTVSCESPLIDLKNSMKSDHFTYQNLRSITKSVLSNSGIFLQGTVFHLCNGDPERKFTAQ